MSEHPPEAVLWDFLRGALMTKALGIVADLGIPDALASGPKHVDELAHEKQIDPDSLYRLLRALASDGLFAECEAGIFRHSIVSEALRRPGWAEFAHLFGGVFYGASADLDRAVRTGAETFSDSFGTGFWPWLGERPDERAAFDAAMAGEKEGVVTRLASVVWRDGETVVDVGGGNGALLVAFFAQRPGLRGIVFDLPETHRDESLLGDDIEFVAGSFFERVPRGDTYVLASILHDWDDDRAQEVLDTIRASASAGARVLIMESVVPLGNEPNGAKWLDLLMLVLGGGRERTESEWRSLLERAGLHVDGLEDGLIQARCP
jgi:hypothetical protein